MSIYRDRASQRKQLLVCCGVCPHRQCHFKIGVSWWNEVHPAGISSDHPKGTGVLVNDGTSRDWFTPEQMRTRREGDEE